MGSFIAYIWLLIVGALVGYDGWRIVNDPSRVTPWIMLGAALGIFAAAVALYAHAIPS